MPFAQSRQTQKPQPWCCTTAQSMVHIGERGVQSRAVGGSVRSHPTINVTMSDAADRSVSHSAFMRLEMPRYLRGKKACNRRQLQSHRNT